MIYSTGSKLSFNAALPDKCEIDNVYQKTLAPNATFKDLIKNIILSNAFRKRDTKKIQQN